MPALVTPFTKSGRISKSNHSHNLEFLVGLGIEGFLIGGSTGEGPLLEAGERATLIKSARRTLGAAPHLMIGIVAESQRQAARQIKESAAAGADAALVLTPVTLGRNSVDVQRRFFNLISEDSTLPVLLYSVPRNTGYALDADLAIELSDHPNIVGMKDSGGDSVRIGRIARESAAGFTVFNGASASIALALAGGAHGAITASTNYLPRTIAALVEAAHENQSEALRLQDTVTSITSQVESIGVPGVKAAAKLLGLKPGLPRAPFEAPGRSWIRSISPLVE